MIDKGRGVAPPVRSGEANHKATLSDSQVEQLRTMATQPGATQRSLARAFGISQSTVFRIVKGHTRNG